MGEMAMSRGLRLKEKNIFWGMFFIILIHGIVDGKLINREKLIEINKKLKQINRPAVKSIQSEDGDIIDCVDIYKQPAFDHPALKNHTIQVSLSLPPPVAILLSQGTAYLGAQGDINVWNPYVASDDEYSAAEISLKNGPYDDFESIESGWAVNPKVYGDRRTRLFAYWTTDASKKTGCFDLTCPGFVQTSKSIALGSVFDTVSKIQGAQYQISISIQMDTNTGNWWLKYGGQNIGYWPKSLFVGLSHMASSVEWGGEVKSSHIGQTHPHTGTDMGSGRMVGVGFGFDCFIRNIRILDNSVTWKFPTYSFPYTDEYYCYDIYYQRYGVTEPEFYFGGPGYDEIRCP
ncbi:uncharacterized protein LOC122064587 [Macadamia integrifolia]|uniref:uncharacterized protein LOC122064587 n=1 Tax=Macadamia integrifolia TaxID=60698 RepID=UPI001C4F89D7|nr:uncharacterized protein LOC122064587 [Macadamia integrifolia]